MQATPMSLVLAWILSASNAATVYTQGEIQAEALRFNKDEQSLSQDWDLALSTRFQLEMDLGVWQSYFEVFSRSSGYDNQRDQIFLKDAWTGLQFTRTSLKLGYQTLNWSSTEAFHPADTINARLYDGSFSDVEKTGKLMLSLDYLLGSSQFFFAYMPRFSSPIAYDYSSRMSYLTQNINALDPIYIDAEGEVNDEELTQQGLFSFRNSSRLGDLQVIYAWHINPALLSTAIPLADSNSLQLFLWHSQDISFNYQVPLNAVLLKVEASHRMLPELSSDFNSKYMSLNTLPEDHSSLALGAEYTYYHANQWESSFFLEGQYTLAEEDAIAAASEIFNQHVLLAYRLFFNDYNGNELFLSSLLNAESLDEQLYALSWQRRLGQDWQLETSYTYTFAENSAHTLHAFHEDQLSTLELTYFF